MALLVVMPLFVHKSCRAVCALCAAVLLALGGCGEQPLPSAQLLWQQAPGAVLQSANGPLPVATLQGHALLVFFGYSFCPDICPTDLAAMGQALAQLTPQEKARVRAVFVTVDPDRDTPEQLQRYLPLFHPDLLGLHVPEPALAALAKSFRVYYLRQAPKAGSQLYAVEHSASTAVVDSQGRIVRLLPHGSPAQALLKALRAVS